MTLENKELKRRINNILLSEENTSQCPHCLFLNKIEKISHHFQKPGWIFSTIICQECNHEWLVHTSIDIHRVNNEK